MPLALVTGGSAGLGRALVHSLADDGWTVVTDGRDAGRLATARSAATDPSRVITVAGDVGDPAHRADLADAVETIAGLGPLDLLVHNASTLGPLPLRPLREYDETDLLATWRVNAAAPAALTTLLLPRLRQAGDAGGVVVAITSDAAAEHYETWGVYAAGKAALEHLTLTAAAEEGLTGLVVDPGDLRTAMHQDAFPGEDISDRPTPEEVVPRLRTLLASHPTTGRYRLVDVPAHQPADQPTSQPSHQEA